MISRRCEHFAAGLLALLLLAPLVARAAEPLMEKRVVAAAPSVRQWSAAESTMQASNAPGQTGQPVLHWHIRVDHFAGEAKYPIGWPRVGFSLREPAARDWSGWDYLQMRVYTQTTRAVLPREPAGLALYTPDKEGGVTRSLSELAKDRWVQIRIPLAQVPRHGDVRQIQLHIAESRYQHEDQLDFYFDEIVLLRYAQPTLLDFTAENAVMFADAQQIPVRFNLTGVKPDEVMEVVCELRQGGKVIARSTVKATRGPQRVMLDLGGSKSAAGDYEVLARVAGGMETAPAPLRLVESPWKAAE